MLLSKHIPRPYTTPKSILNLLCSTCSSHSIVRHIIGGKVSHFTSQGYPAMMADPGRIPYQPQDVQEVQALLGNLESAAKKGYRCRRTGFKVTNSPKELLVHSWRFQDSDYKRRDLPTYARGLFTGRNENGQPEICIRGYDKFFNTGEVHATKWPTIKQATQGPYELSLKENGCIIFISGLHDGSLLVCSKHSTGPRNEDVSHAMAGEKWVDKHLASVGKTRQELAKDLRDRNATAVFELCDDAFEEHILAYDRDNAGLYLHGININIPEFMTYSGAQVQAYAEEWGFRKTDFLVYDDIDATKAFLDEVAESGHYNGRDIEGFVIRCKARQDSADRYRDWFFKYKFEEPYLMYRQWRECTKSIIDGRRPRFKKHIKITEEYLFYARSMLAKNPHLAKAYEANHGIIKLRDDFLKEKNLKGSDIIRAEYGMLGGDPADATGDIILVPVATLGCGKTTIAVALTHLFGWGHVQNDNITGKARPPRFTKEVLTQLEKVPVVFADRNNAQRHERGQILADVQLANPQIRPVALNFVHSPDALGEIRKVTQDRVLARGDNHQTIQAATDSQKVVGIMEGFIQRFEALNTGNRADGRFDAVIDLDPTLDSRENLETVVRQLHSLYPKLITDMPSSEDLDEAIKFALSEYRPEIRHTIGGGEPKDTSRMQNQKAQKPQGAKKAKPLEYVSVNLPKVQILDVLETAFGSVSSDKARFFRTLQQDRRVQNEFHVTLIHRASSKVHPELWQKYSDLHAAAGDPGNPNTKIGDCKILLEKIVWDDRLMAIVARIVDEGWECTNQVAHITVGTRGEDVKPKESNDLLKRWIEKGSGDDSGIGEVDIGGRPIVDGTVKGILSR